VAESLILQDFIIEYQAYTGGFNGITDYDNYTGPAFLWFILAVSVVFFVLSRMLTHSRIGTVLKSIRDNDVRAEFMGYNVANYRIFVFCVSAFMAAAGGAMKAGQIGRAHVRTPVTGHNRMPSSARTKKNAASPAPPQA